MAYFDQEMKSEMKNRLETFFPTWKFSIRVNHHSSVIVSILRADEDIFNQVMEVMKELSCDLDLLEYYEKLGIFDITYFANKARNSTNEKLKNTLDLLEGILNLEDHPKHAYYYECDSMSDSSRVAYYKSLWLGDKRNQKPFEYRPAKVKKSLKTKLA